MDLLIYLTIINTPHTLGKGHCQQNGSVRVEGKSEWINLDHIQTSAGRCEGQSTETEKEGIKRQGELGDIGKGYRSQDCSWYFSLPPSLYTIFSSAKGF